MTVISTVNIDEPVWASHYNQIVNAVNQGGVLFAPDLSSLAGTNTTGLTSRAAIVLGVGLYRWVSGSALSADGFNVVDSDYSGQWVLELFSLGYSPDFTESFVSSLATEVQNLKQKISDFLNSEKPDVYVFNIPRTNISVSANSISVLDFMVPGSVTFGVGDIAQINPPRTNTTSIGIGGAYWRTENQLSVTLINPTGSTINVADGFWTLHVLKWRKYAK